jgi:protoporphyrinogen oxidase
LLPNGSQAIDISRTLQELERTLMLSNSTGPRDVVIIGAGPAGLTAGYMLSKRHVPVTILESDAQYVGGISRTVNYKGFCFDIGGHRFFSKSREIENLWSELLPNDMLERPRISRILYRGKLFSYPLKPVEALAKLGVLESALCFASYLKARLQPCPSPKSFQDWVTNEFGSRLFEIFFKTYTEKVWGMSCKEISADWAAQRIRGLSLWAAVRDGLRGKRTNGDRQAVIKTLINSFRYPRKGPGMMWEACATKIQAMGGRVVHGQRVVQCLRNGGSPRWTVISQAADGQRTALDCDHVISSAPVRELAGGLQPALSEHALRAAESLKYRDFLTVALILRDRRRLPDNWIYIHDPGVKVGRIQNYKSWSEEMVPDAAFACYGLEYFCFENDGLWNAPDRELKELAGKELQAVGIAAAGDIVDGCVVRQKKAYPVYDDDYAFNVDIVRREIEQVCPGLHLVGRNGMHKYNNQDHAMMTAMLTVENITAGMNLYDVWRVNQDAEYHENGEAPAERTMTAGRLVPSHLATAKE